MKDATIAEAAGDIAHDELEGREVVGGGQRVGIPEVDLVLPGGHLVVGGLNLEAHLHQLLDDDAPDLLTAVDRPQVEVRRGVMGDGGRRPIGRLLEQKELSLTPGHHRKAQLAGPLDLALECRTRAPGKRLLVRSVDVAEQPGHASTLVFVGQNPERVQIRLEQHVGFFDPDEAFDRRSIEHDLTVERLLELAARHLDVLVDSEDVGELEADEVDAEAPGELQHLGLPGSAQIGRKPFEGRAFDGPGRTLLYGCHQVPECGREEQRER